MDLGRLDLVLQYALAAAGQEDPDQRELGPIHLIKYAYLADLAYAETHSGETFTGVAWRFYHFGPWAAEVNDRIEYAAELAGARRRTFESAKHEGEFARFSVVDDTLFERLQRQLPWEITSAVKRAVHEFSSDTSSLLHYVYVTKPMLKAAPGELLSFGDEPASTLCQAEPALAHDEAAPVFEVDVLENESPARSSWKARRKRKETVAKLRQEVRRRLEARLARPAIPVRPPRYDEVFFDGVKWLDDQAGGPIQPFEGEAVFSPDIWKSPGRSDPDVP